jgi:hypothetical protein
MTPDELARLRKLEEQVKRLMADLERREAADHDFASKIDPPLASANSTR